MRKKIQVLGIEIDNFTAKEGMKSLVAYMKTEPVSVIEMITMNTFTKFSQDEQIDELFGNIDIAFASDRGILEAAGEQDERRLKEADEQLFIKMAMRFLHKNKTRVFLLAEDEVAMQKLETDIQADYPNIQIMGKATVAENGASDDMILNLVNGAEAECVLSVLSSSEEEYFIFRNKLLINARVWLGFGKLLDELGKEKTGLQKLKGFFLRQLLKKEIAKKGENA